MITAGHLGHVGLSEAGAATIRRGRPADRVLGAVAGIEAEVLPTCRELGVA
jgi:hypothetical protein